MLVMPAPPAFAQEAEGSQVSEGGLEEIVVTARKRSENLQEPPVAVSATTGDRLEARGIIDIAGAAKFFPSLVSNTGAPIGGASNSAVVFIRGIGQADFQLTIDPGLGSYLDGVRSVGALLDATDIERLGSCARAAGHTAVEGQQIADVQPTCRRCASPPSSRTMIHRCCAIV